MKIRQLFTGREFTACLVWPEGLGDPWVEVVGIGRVDPFALEVVEATTAELHALPEHWRELVTSGARD